MLSGSLILKKLVCCLKATACHKGSKALFKRKSSPFSENKIPVCILPKQASQPKLDLKIKRKSAQQM